MAGTGRGAPVLVTGFVPFGGVDRNPSSEVAEALDGVKVGDRTVLAATLPVARAGARERLTALFEDVRPSAVLLLGLANGRIAPAVERLAVNVLDFPIPDNDGEQPVDRPVVNDGPTAYFSTLPVKAVLASWRRAGIPGYVSNTAGTYVCNASFYLASHLGARSGARVGLIHLPYLPEQVAGSAGRPDASMEFNLQVSCVRTALEVAVTHAGTDVVLAAGAVS